MSTKITPAWKLPEGTDPFSLVPIVRQFAANKIQEIEELKLHDELTRILDSVALENATLPKMPVSQALVTVNNRRDPLDNVNISAYLFKDTKTDSILLLANSTELAELAQDLGWQDFHYRNDVDKPSSVTEEDWLNRKETWERVYPKGAAGNYGLLIETTSSNYIYSVSEPRFMNVNFSVEDKLPRLQHLLLKYGKPDNIITEQLIDIILSVNTTLTEPHNQNIVENLISKIRVLTPEDYTTPNTHTTTLTVQDLKTAWGTLFQ